MNTNLDSDINDQPLSDHIVVSGLVQKVLDHFSVHTVSDLCGLDIDVVAKEKGVGVKKVETIRTLIEQAQQLAGFTPPDLRSERIQHFSTDVRLDQPLLYVPSFLKESFRRLEIDTVSKLLRLEEADLAGLPSWGEKKSLAALALRDLYQTLLSNADPDQNASLSSFVPKPVLPDRSLAPLSLESFIECSDQPSLKGKAIQETLDLRSLLRLWIHGDEHEEDFAELDWRDVPLQINSRVRDFLDKHSLQAIGDLEQLATRGWLTHPLNGSRVSAIDADNFGGSSLESLRNEVVRLKADGLRKYRGKVICDIENLEAADWAWESVPLRLRAKAQTLLRKCQVSKIADVHRAAVRSQLPCPETATWKNVGELDGFTEAIVEELRRELNRLAKSGLDVYRFGEGGPPKDATEFVARVRELLDSRAVSMLQDSLEGRTFDDIGDEHEITRARAQQIVSTSLKKLHVFQDVANALLEPALPLLDLRLYVPIHELAKLTQCQQAWEVRLLIAVSEFDWSTSDTRGVCQFPSKTIDDFYRGLKTLANGTSGFDFSKIKSVGDLVDAHQMAAGKQSDLTERLAAIAEKAFPPDACHLLLGEDWIKNVVRSQLVAAGVNGLAFDQIDTGGFVQSASELAILLGSVPKLPFHKIG